MSDEAPSTPAPDDPFVLLGVPAQPWLDDKLLISRYDALSRETHPDAARRIGDFEELNEAFETLSSPVRRLKALLAHFGEAPAARTGVVDDDMVERFMELTEFLERTDKLIERYQATTSQVARALLAPGLEESKRKVAVFLDGLDEELAAQTESLQKLNPQFNPDGPPPAAPTFATLRTLLQTSAFLTKWREELRKREFSLENA